MSKALQGAAAFGGAIALGGVAFLLASTGVGFGALPFLLHGMEALALAGIADEVGAISDALTSGRGTNIATRTPAGFRQIVRGTIRVGGTIVWRSTTGSTHRQLNYAIPFSTHLVCSFMNLYLDGRKVYFSSGVGNTTRNGVTFGGAADGNDHQGPGGQTYNFGNLVYAEAKYGDQLPGDVIGGFTANDPAWSASQKGSPFLGGCAYIYLKVRQDANQFSGEPEVRLTLQGKPVYDPRTGTTGYSENWALHVADHMTDPIYGLGLNVNEEQLIVAANVCDEQVALANGQTEARYTLHMKYDTSTPPSAVLEKMLAGAAGRVTEVGGEWYIWPAYWQGPSASLSADNLRGPVRWQGFRGLADRSNLVTGTYIAANYPYSVSGNLYDSNGWYEGNRENTFNFAYQPTNFPQYAHDTDHGFAADEYLERDTNYQGVWANGTTAREGAVYKGADGLLYESLSDGNTHAPEATSVSWRITTWRYLPLELNLETVTSAGQAQRVAKIALERNRQEGSGSFNVNLGAFGSLQATSTFNLTFDPAGWVDKLLEVTKCTFRQEFDGGAPMLGLEIEVQETAASVYEWSLPEEQKPQGGAASPASGSTRPVPPTNLQLTSSAATALRQPDGTVVPRIELTWDTPLDGLVSQIQQQHRLTGALNWTDDPLVDISLNQSYVVPCVAGLQYDVRIRSRRSNGASSEWAEIDGYTAGLVLNTATQDGLGTGSLVGQAYADGTAGIKCTPHTERLGSNDVALFPAGAKILRGLQQQTLYAVYYVDPTYSGGDVTPIATTIPADYLGKLGYILIGSVVTPYAGAGGGTGGAPGAGTRFYPTAYSDSGSSNTASPDAAYDMNLQTAADVSGDAERTETSGEPEVFSADGDLVLSGFQSVTLAAASTLSVDYDAQVSGGTGSITVTVGSTNTVLVTLTADTARTTAAASIPAGTDLSTVSLRIRATPSVPTGVEPSRSVTVSIYETYIDA